MSLTRFEFAIENGVLLLGWVLQCEGGDVTATLAKIITDSGLSANG